MPFWGRKKKKKGPFDANRILDTEQVKVDQVFTKDGKPVALFASVTEDQSRKIGAEGYVGGTDVGVKGGIKGSYESDRKWRTYPLFWTNNIPGAIPLDRAYPQIKEAVRAGPGTLLPDSVPFHDVAHVNSVPISDSAHIQVNEDGQTMISGDFTISGSSIRKKDEEKEVRRDD